MVIPRPVIPWYRKIYLHIRYIVKTALYWLRTHTINRYHMLDMRCPENGYDWGWCDRTELMLYANFKLLVDFIEKEKPFEWIDFSSSEEHQHMEKELKELYHWWKVQRPADKKTMDSWKSGEYDLEFMDAYDKRDDEMLLRLVKIRGILWT